MESITKIIANLERRVDDLQRDNDGLKQSLLDASTSVEALSRRVSVLERGLAMKSEIK
ncbi:TPA: hypothetical protein ACOFEN_004628 [Bacillus cereus]|uniref:hypothetical protein n=1 Tax=Bacillus cereus TaxID=1396 RepID=UPI0015D4DEBA|nr:hypothetical protein [Bacillus cereus]MCB5900284.1 hypothetical protein [Bacillus cereus]